MLRLSGAYQTIERMTMTNKKIRLLALISLCLAFTSGYMAAAGQASQPSSGYKILYFPTGERLSRLTGNQGIPKDALNGCVPISISPSPDNIGLFILCKG
jgi:hypothetical protein